MKKIQRYVEHIAEELDGAKEYIEKALDYKSRGDTVRYTKYKEMSLQELGHANIIHEFAVQDIDAFEKVFPEFPQEMLDKWEHAHNEFVEKAAWIKQMQSM